MQLVILECWTPKMKAIRFFEILATTYQLTWSNIPEDSIFRQKSVQINTTYRKCVSVSINECNRSDIT